jgi:hypothetical protein
LAALQWGRTRSSAESLDLTNERIHEILDQKDIASLKGIGDVPS